MHKVSSIIKLRNNRQPGMSLVEVLLAAAIFAVISTGLIGGIIYGQESTAVAGARERAVKIAEEGVEAVRNIRDSGYSNLPVDGTYGLTISGGVWSLSGSSDTTDIFTRTVNLATIDSRTRELTVNVSWTQTVQRAGSISLNAYLDDFVTVPTYFRKGMLVYGDGGNSSDAIKYQIYDDSTGTWSVAAATADVDGSSSNKYLRAAKVYSSPTRNEKVLVSRHYNGTSQFIYAQVYDGTTGVWGNVVQLSTWTANTFLDVQNFDATYSANGNLTVVFSDNTIIPKSRVWNGSAWASQTSLTTLSTSGRIPNYINLKSRPGTNEIMFAESDQANDTTSQYYNGSSWLAITAHGTNSTSNTKKLVDFVWSSSDTTKGVLVYTAAASDKGVTARTFTSNGAGSGTWGTAFKYATNQTNNIGSVSLSAVPGTTNFVACNKDAGATPVILCGRLSTTAWVASSNVTIASATDTGIQPSSALEFEPISAQYGVSLYSDNTTTAHLKKFNISTNTWDAAATNVNPSVVGVIKTARIETNPINDDMMLFVSDANMDLYSVIWDGTNNQLFTTPAGKAWTAHGIQGSATTDYWYDFAWDGI